MIGRQAHARAVEPTEGSQNHSGSTPHNGSSRRRPVDRSADGVPIDCAAMYAKVHAYLRRSRLRYERQWAITGDDHVAERDSCVFRSDEIWDLLAREEPLSELELGIVLAELVELALEGERLTRALELEDLDGLLLKRLRPDDLANRTGVPMASSRGTADPTPSSSKRTRH